ncbi:hypothetical protein IAR55_006887 [Kwoniella newhampshirensis]|uniref:Stress-response A/B barrel domain-containing protein n=1 Tax=Kwoniella newhampshirensis TaxID=1651941 RepID=A0AAW0YE86_9TREE
MTFHHTITFFLSSASLVPYLAQDMLSTIKTCIKPDGCPYIRSITSGVGRQVSSGSGDGVARVVFILGFENSDDLKYFVNEDSSHIMFKTRCETELGVMKVETTTFEDAVYQTARSLSVL